jgi:hypothetical protein
VDDICRLILRLQQHIGDVEREDALHAVETEAPQASLPTMI